MKQIKSIIKESFKSFIFFYTRLRYRIFAILGVNVLVAVLDSFGLTMFLPLLQLTDKDADFDKSQMGSMSFLIDGFDSIGVPLNTYTALIAIALFFTLKGLFKFMGSYLRVLYQQYFIRILRVENTDALADFSYYSFVNTDSGRIQNTFTSEVERVNSAFRGYFMTIQAMVLVAVYISLAFIMTPRFALLITVGGLLSNLIFKGLYKATKKASRAYTSESHSFQGLLLQNVTNFKYLKATALIFPYAIKLKKRIYEIEGLQRKMGILKGLMQALREPITMVIVVFVIIIQMELFGEGIGTIVLSLLLFYRAMIFLLQAQNEWNNFLSFEGSLSNMQEFSGELKAGRERYGDVSFDNFSDKIELKDLVFNYEKTPILKSINLTFKKNDTIAVIGESGSGKTTLINILSGLIKPDGGQIEVDGVSLADIDIRTFQKRIGYITQEPVIFNDSIFNNVSFWAEKTPENFNRFHEALKRASIDSFVAELPEKEETVLGQNGINLSGGQKQRLSIARELFKEVDFLMMDEATSALDSETEKSIRENIDALRGKYTIIIIAHRLSTVKNVDKIVILKKGMVQTVGTYKQLMEESEEFRTMIKFQELS